MHKFKTITTLITSLILLSISSAYAGQKPPKNYFAKSKKPLTIIVPRGKGGGSHQLSKEMARELKKIIGVKVKVINLPKHHGVDAINQFMKAPPNGYTILQHVDDVVSLYVKGESRFHPTKDMVPVAITQITFSQVYIRNIEKRFHDWESFVKYTKKHPKQVKISLVGHKGSMESLFLGMLTKAYDLDVVKHSYNKPAERYLSLVEGKADALIEQPGDVRPFLDRRLIKPILTLLPEKHPTFPDAASLADVPGKFHSLYRARMFLANAKTPKKRLAYLEWAFKKAFNSKRYQRFNDKKYMNLVNSYRDMKTGTEFLNHMLITYEKLLTPAATEKH